MKIIDKTEEKITSLSVGDIIILRNSDEVQYEGTKRLVCKNSNTNKYQVITLEDNEVVDYQYKTLEHMYEDYKKDIVTIVRSENIELILK